jgi:undecaprenyl-diphosphatase
VEALNLRWFYLLNAGPNLDGWPLSLATIAAEHLIYIVPPVLAGGWLWGSNDTRSAVLTAALVGALALGLNYSIALLWFHPRPFMAHVGHDFLAHAPDSSFPSDHVTLMWSVGMVMASRGVTRYVGALILGLAVVTAWARIYLGVHYPLDMIGAVTVATAMFLAFRPLRTLADRHLLPALEFAYRRLFAWPIDRGWINR